MGKILSPTGGLHLSSDSTPTSVTLSAKACLIDADYNTTCVSMSRYVAIGLDFGSPARIQKIRIYFTLTAGYTDYTGTWFSIYDRFDVYTSENNSAWTFRQTFEAPVITVVAGSLAYAEMTLTAMVEARYVKIRAAEQYWYANTISHGACAIIITELEAFDDSVEIAPPVVEIHITAHPASLLPIFMDSASIEISGHPPSPVALLSLPAAGITILAKIPTASMEVSPDHAEIAFASFLPSYVWTIPASMRPAAQVIYTCTLTGDGESPAVPDLTLPMSSFQGRMRDGDPSYISAVIPTCMVYADDILARQNGDIVIKKGYRFQDGSTQLEEIARVDFESVRIDQGSKSASATISGHKTISSTSVKTVTVEGVSYYCLQADGKRRVRALLDLFLRIGDNCIYGSNPGDKMIVGYITYTVSTTQTLMEVVEA